ncbi:hypothetical protein BDW62DRAFT_209972 [Aspergillus aurantiobrunneus]
MDLSPYPNEDYRVGWIFDGPVPGAAAISTLKENWHHPQKRPRGDMNQYCMGTIGDHKVVTAMSLDGPLSVATLISDTLVAFPNLRVILLVGVASGMPNYEDHPTRDIRLGDVVVGVPSDASNGGVKVYASPNGRDVEEIRSLDRPPMSLLTGLNRVQSASDQDPGSKVKAAIDHVLERYPHLGVGHDGGDSWIRPDASTDRLYRADFQHIDGSSQPCSNCAESKEVPRDPRLSDKPVVHRGTIASYGWKLESPVVRDKLRDLHGALCCATEAWQLRRSFPGIVIQGIAEYGDSHANTKWRGYAAGAAAGLAKELLLATPAADLEREKLAADRWFTR